MLDKPRTLLDKIWKHHVVHTLEDGTELLYIDRHFFHEGSRYAFAELRRTERPLRRPKQSFGFTDHWIPTENQHKGVDSVVDLNRRTVVKKMESNTREFGVRHFDLFDERRGIVHVVGPEQGLTQPGMTIVCGDSHTSTHGALGALAFGIGASEVGHVMATQCLWQKKPKNFRIQVDNRLPIGVSAKDLALFICAKLGMAGGTGYVLEYQGSAIDSLSIEGRMTLCNMSIEAGARAALIAPDEKTIAFVKGRVYAPQGEAFEQAVTYWKTMTSDQNAHFDREENFHAADVAPFVSFGTSIEDALSISEAIPDPKNEPDEAKRRRLERSLSYMGLKPGDQLEGLAIDQVFIGSCTNGRIEDLRAAAQVVQGHKAQVPSWVVPGSMDVRRQAESEGLDRIFKEAGFEWREPGCSMCLGVNGEIIAPGKRCASTSNRNFEGRQGPDARTHLLSPAMAALAAITGKLSDIRAHKTNTFESKPKEHYSVKN